MSETTPETNDLRERLLLAIVGPCSQCGEPFTDRACGPTHALVATNPMIHRHAKRLDALLPVVAQEIAAAEQRGREDKTTHITHVEFAQMIADAEQRGRAEVRARVEALAVEWTEATCQTDGAPCSWHRVSAECGDELRAALAEPAAEEHP